MSEHKAVMAKIKRAQVIEKARDTIRMLEGDGEPAALRSRAVSGRTFGEIDAEIEHTLAFLGRLLRERGLVRTGYVIQADRHNRIKVRLERIATPAKTEVPKA